MAAVAASARLTVDLHALEANYRLLQAEAGDADVAGVVKADAYGLGWRPVVDTLWRAGCRTFFVARIDEGIALRSIWSEVVIHVLDGAAPGTEKDLVAHRLVPVVNTLEQLQRWRQASLDASDDPLPTVLHVDTGMQRLGVTVAQAQHLAAEDHWLEGLDVQMIMSHLVSADEASSDLAEQQLDVFRQVRTALPMGRASLANSAGLWRGPEFRFDVVRPGYALYGGNPQPERRQPNPMNPVVSVEVPVLQIRSAEPGDTVGYGASHCFERVSRLATISLGYADGLPRSSSNRGSVFLDGQALPIVGRVSMDLVTVDVTDFVGDIEEGTLVEAIGAQRTVDDVGQDAGTIGYEILTALGRRFQRRYLGSSDHE